MHPHYFLSLPYCVVLSDGVPRTPSVSSLVSSGALNTMIVDDEMIIAIAGEVLGLMTVYTQHALCRVGLGGVYPCVSRSLDFWEGHW